MEPVDEHGREASPPAPAAEGSPALARLGPGLLRVRAPNPGPLTADGTNTYVLGARAACVIDPGPDDPGHLAAILGAVGGRPVAAVVVTHGHRDHSALAPRLSRATGAPVLAHGAPGPGSGPGIDRAFRPDRHLGDGEVVAGDGFALRVVHAPGHLPDHLCLDAGRDLFSGDHAMGWATSVVAPPEGDMGAYLASLERCLALGSRRLLPGHGEPVEDGSGRLRDLLAHRRAREAQVIEALRGGPADAQGIALSLHAGLAPALRGAARANVLAHLLDLARRGLVEPVGRSEAFRLAERPWTPPGPDARAPPG